MDNDTDGRDFATRQEGKLSADGQQQDALSQGKKPVQQAHERLVLADPAAFRYLEEDPSTTVLERRRRLKGYELYFVEPWACSRVHPTFVITTYTGLEHHSVVVSVLGIPTNEEAWSPRLRVYLQAITKYHARRKETPLGTLMVTNLSGFPSALTVIPVPDGDLRPHREEFILNEDLKRMGCSGRAGLNLAPPIGATEAKFSQLYHTSDQVPIASAAVELVKLCQAALMLFGKLPSEYVDGLLCDVTEQAISDWWADIGTEVFNIDPNDGILGPTTVAALLGILMGARNRLSAYGAPVAKDVFDIANTKRGIAYFQKSQKSLERTRRLDRQTLGQLHRVTAKAASGEGWAVPRAVKSTVAELSGKGGDLVNGREKAGVAEVETLDIETFIRFGSGERFKWLWYGKPRKNNESNVFSNLGAEDGLVFNDNEQGGYSWSGKNRDSPVDEPSRHTLADRIYSTTHGSQTSMDHFEKDPALRKAVFKNVSEKVTDARSGLGRIRDAVGRRGLRGHHHKYSKDGNMMADDESLKDRTPRGSTDQPGALDLPSDTSRLSRSPPRYTDPSTTGSNESSRQRSHHPEGEPRFNVLTTKTSFYNTANDSSLETSAPVQEDSGTRSDYMTLINGASGIQNRSRAHSTNENQTAESITTTHAEAIKKMESFDWASTALPPLRSTRSLSHLARNAPKSSWGSRWPRRMSFTAMVDVLAASTPHSPPNSNNPLAHKDAATALTLEKSLALEARLMDANLHRLQTLDARWVEAKVGHIEHYDQQCQRDHSKIDLVFHHRLDENHALRDNADACLARDRTHLLDAAKDAETLAAKLEYELSALQSKVEDVEEGAGGFERQVDLLEGRVGGLERERVEGGWVWGCVRWLGWGGGRE